MLTLSKFIKIDERGGEILSKIQNNDKGNDLKIWGKFFLN